MLRSTASKIMWVGRATVFLVGLTVILALVLGVASAAFGANGGNFILGQLNKATAITKLVGNVAGGPALHVVNNKTDAGSRALQLGVAKNKPPIVVNANAGKAPNLNADKVDGLDSTDFVRPRFANINSNGTVRHGRGVVHDPLMTRKRGTGWYQVGFNTDVRDCAFAATISGGFAGMTGVRSGLELRNTVEVFTLHTSGAPNDYPFHLVVAC